MTSHSCSAPARLGPPRRTALQSLVRRRLHAALARLRSGELELSEAGELHRFGPPAEGVDALRSRVEVQDPAFYSSLARGGTLGAAEGWMRGEWHASDLTALLRMLTRDEDVLAGFDAGLARVAEPALRLAHWLRRNTRRGARRNIAAHYDLGNDFFALFLDPTLSYSSGIFERDGASMEDASRAKFDRLCRKLGLGPATTCSKSARAGAASPPRRLPLRLPHHQHDDLRRATPARAERIVDAGLSERVTVLGRDYRELEGSFDKLVSIEMIESVGAEHIPTYFRACGECLAPGGRLPSRRSSCPTSATSAPAAQSTS